MLTGCATTQGSWKYSGKSNFRIQPDCVAASTFQSKNSVGENILLRFGASSSDWVIEKTYKDIDNYGFQFLARLERKKDTPDILIIRPYERNSPCKEENLLSCPNQKFLTSSIAKKVLTKNQGIADKFYSISQSRAGLSLVGLSLLLISLNPRWLNEIYSYRRYFI